MLICPPNRRFPWFRALLVEKERWTPPLSNEIGNFIYTLFKWRQLFDLMRMQLSQVRCLLYVRKSERANATKVCYWHNLVPQSSYYFLVHCNSWCHVDVSLVRLTWLRILNPSITSKYAAILMSTKGVASVSQACIIHSLTLFMHL